MDLLIVDKACSSKWRLPAEMDNHLHLFLPWSIQAAKPDFRFVQFPTRSESLFILRWGQNESRLGRRLVDRIKMLPVKTFSYHVQSKRPLEMETLFCRTYHRTKYLPIIFIYKQMSIHRWQFTVQSRSYTIFCNT